MTTPLRHPNPNAPRSRTFARPLALIALFACALSAGTGCDAGGSEPLAPYEGDRALDILRVTQRFEPEIQWVGGRVAALGVNRGTRAALDSTLVWLRTAPDNSINSFVTYGEGMDAALVQSFGGTPQGSLTDGETYTFWLAERAAFDVGLDSARVDPAAFADTTFTMSLILPGNAASTSDLGVVFEIERDERLTGERFLVRWTPADVPFRRMAIRKPPRGAGALGGFQDLIWHILTPEEQPPSITSPIAIGGEPAGVQVVVPFEGASFERDVVYHPPSDVPGDEDVEPRPYVLWAVTDDWPGTSFSATNQANRGYAQFQISGCFFDNDDPCEQ